MQEKTGILHHHIKSLRLEIIKNLRNFMFDNKTLNTLIFSAAIVTFGYFISNGLIFFNSGHNKSVNVKGIGERIIKADQAFWSISFES